MTSGGRSGCETRPIRLLELFAGLGGASAAASDRFRTIAAVEIDADARSVSEANFPHPCFGLEICSVPDEFFKRHAADVWWLSPPCTPFTRRGCGRDADDSRNRALLRLIDVVSRLGPPCVAVENVVGFETSHTFARLRREWESSGYEIHCRTVCPTDIGWPNKRPRVYTVAAKSDAFRWQPIRQTPRTLADVLVDVPAMDVRELMVEDAVATGYAAAMSRLHMDDPDAVSSCFTRAYGKSPVRSGSYLQTSVGLRRFSPAEVAALLGFPHGWNWPSHLSRRRRWQLLGNSLSIPVARWVLDSIATSLFANTGQLLPSRTA